MLELFNTYRGDVQHAASVALALAAWRWGGGPERWLIALFIATMVLPTYLFRGLGAEIVIGGPSAWAYFGVDLVALAGFTLVALYANRNYPLWVAGFQLVAIGAHAVRELVDNVSTLAIVILIVGPAYFQLALMSGGFLRHLQRVRRFGSYRDWRSAPAPLLPLQA